MMEKGKNILFRMNFLKSLVLAVGLAMGFFSWHMGCRTALAGEPEAGAVSAGAEPRLPREVWIACVSSNGIKAKDPDDMIRQMLARMEEVVPYKPDIICLPENFPCQCQSNPSLAEIAEVPPGPVTQRFAEFAKKHHTNVILATRTKEAGHYYNSAVVLDRQGQVVGEYRKTHLTVGEMEDGLSPGPLDPPVFDLDFGRIGIQICFDIAYLDGWQKLNEKGAEIVFWPSAFAGGDKLNMLAKLSHYVVVSSTRSRVSKICDIDGSEVAASGHREATWCCGPVNLEKAFLHTWPYDRRFGEIKAKYGRKIKIKTFYEEEWTVIESRSADVKIADVLKEFEIKTYDGHVKEAEIMQNERRP